MTVLEDKAVLRARSKARWDATSALERHDWFWELRGEDRRSLLSAIINLMVSSHQRPEWQPIETVPGDEYGVNVIFALPSGEVGCGRSYVNQSGERVYSMDSVWLEADETPTHWMPLPPPPETTK